MTARYVGPDGPPGGPVRWHRVAVVGASAVGKTDLGWELSTLIGAPLISLDALRWRPGGTATDGEYAAAVARATATDTWTMEGADASAPVRRAWQETELIVWLDHSRGSVLQRLFGDPQSWITGAGLGPRRLVRHAAYLARKARRSMQQAAEHRQTLPPVLGELAAAGVEVVRLTSVESTARWLSETRHLARAGAESANGD